jgi:transcriptional regulator with XRE-family HTH domain
MKSPNENHWKTLVLMLKNIAEAKGITQEQIAEKSGLLQSNISRVFSLRYCPTLQTFLAIATAIEVNFFFEDKESKTELSVMFEKAMAELGRRPDKLSKN